MSLNKIFLPITLVTTTPLMASDISRLDLMEVFRASPFIYTTLLAMSLFSLVLWLYSMYTLRLRFVMPSSFINKVRQQLGEKQYTSAFTTCQNTPNLTAAILASGIASRGHGHQVVTEAMQTEGKRCGVTLWQRISLINDVAVIAPMIGLLGTVLGLFYAFYDVNRSPDTLASIFDGLGIAVGTTVAGLIVAILAMVFYATLKFRVVRLLNTIENETVTIGHLIEAT